MSRENVDLARRAFDAFNRRDFPAFFERFHPGLTYRNREDEPDVRLCRGLEDFKGYVGSWLEMFAGLRLETRDFIDLGDEVIVVAELRGRGRSTGAEVHGSYVFLLRFREGLIVEGREYATAEEAREAAGPRA
jgi:ketosteroid isomerase-like protein